MYNWLTNGTTTNLLECFCQVDTKLVNTDVEFMKTVMFGDLEDHDSFADFLYQLIPMKEVPL